MKIKCGSVCFFRYASRFIIYVQWEREYCQMHTAKWKQKVRVCIDNPQCVIWNLLYFALQYFKILRPKLCPATIMCWSLIHIAWHTYFDFSENRLKALRYVDPQTLKRINFHIEDIHAIVTVPVWLWGNLLVRVCVEVSSEAADLSSMQHIFISKWP
jgi:hypothetical protein